MIEASVSAVELAEELRKPQFPNQLDEVAAAGVAAVAVAEAEAVWFSRSSFLAHINGTGPRSYSLLT